jgi:hypothetical protein
MKLFCPVRRRNGNYWTNAFSFGDDAFAVLEGGMRRDVHVVVLVGGGGGDDGLVCVWGS